MQRFSAEEALARVGVTRRIEVVQRVEETDQVAGLLGVELRPGDAQLLHPVRHVRKVVPHRGRQIDERARPHRAREIGRHLATDPVDRMALDATLGAEHPRPRERVLARAQHRLGRDHAERCDESCHGEDCPPHTSHHWRAFHFPLESGQWPSSSRGNADTTRGPPPGQWNKCTRGVAHPGLRAALRLHFRARPRCPGRGPRCSPGQGAPNDSLAIDDDGDAPGAGPGRDPGRPARADPEVRRRAHPDAAGRAAAGPLDPSRPPRSPPSGPPPRASTTSSTSIPRSRWRRPTPSWASWPRSGPGRTATATWCSSCGRDVKWHDGQPFTSRDVKFTFDLVREAPEATAKLRLNPRKDWYANVEAIETADPYTVVFRLKRPQPSILMMLASGQSPVYPAHVPLAEQRSRCVGTGPFKFKEWRRGEYVEYVKNPDYFVKGRPVPRRAQVRDHQRARHPHRGAPGRAARQRGPGRDHQEHRRPAQGRGAGHGDHPGGVADLAEPARQPRAPAVQRRAGAAGGGSRHRPRRLHQGCAPGRRGGRRGARAQALRLVGPRRRRARRRSWGGPTGARRRRGSSSPRPATARRTRCASRRRRAASRPTWTWPPTW